MRTGGRASAAVGLVASFVTWGSAADAEPPEAVRKTETSGLAVSGGIGNQYPIVGAQLAYYVQVPRSLFRVVPYVGAGAAVCTDQPGAGCTWGGVAGVMGSWGRRHRILVDAFYGTIGAFSLSLHGHPLDAESANGVGLAAGYEYMAFGGFFLRTDAGVGYMLLPPLLRDQSAVTLTLTIIGLGYKFW